MHARHDRTVINDDGRRWEYEPWRDGEFGPRNLARTFDEVWVRGEGARPDPALPAGYLYVLDPAVVGLPLEQKGSA